MANVSHMQIMKILNAANEWLTFEQVYDQMFVEHDFAVFYAHLMTLVEQKKIQYIPSSGMDRAWFGAINLKKDW